MHLCLSQSWRESNSKDVTNYNTRLSNSCLTCKEQRMCNVWEQDPTLGGKLNDLKHYSIKQNEVYYLLRFPYIQVQRYF